MLCKHINEIKQKYWDIVLFSSVNIGYTVENITVPGCYCTFFNSKPSLGGSRHPAHVSCFDSRWRLSSRARCAEGLSAYRITPKRLPCSLYCATHRARNEHSVWRSELSQFHSEFKWSALSLFRDGIFLYAFFLFAMYPYVSISGPISRMVALTLFPAGSTLHWLRLKLNIGDI